jgi:hypothetical protein
VHEVLLFDLSGYGPKSSLALLFLILNLDGISKKQQASYQNARLFL